MQVALFASIINNNNSSLVQHAQSPVLVKVAMQRLQAYMVAWIKLHIRTRLLSGFKAARKMSRKKEYNYAVYHSVGGYKATFFIL